MEQGNCRRGPGHFPSMTVHSPSCIATRGLRHPPVTVICWYGRVYICTCLLVCVCMAGAATYAGSNGVLLRAQQKVPLVMAANSHSFVPSPARNRSSFSTWPGAREDKSSTSSASEDTCVPIRRRYFFTYLSCSIVIFASSIGIGCVVWCNEHGIRGCRNK